MTELNLNDAIKMSQVILFEKANLSLTGKSDHHTNSQ